MNTTMKILFCVILATFVTSAQAQLPADFPEFNITQNGDTAPGLLIGSVSSSNPEVGSYFMIMDNTGVPLLYSDTQSLGGLACNGLFTYRTEIPGMSKKYTWYFQDVDFSDVDTFQLGNGYLADNHDFQVLPNGHVLMLCYDHQTVDMSQLVEGGHPAANVIGAVIQELDVNKNVIFQWRSWDHIPILDTYRSGLTGGNIPYIHVNSVEFDVTDGNIILSCRETSEIIKISRVTGEVMWRMGGKNNEFTILNDHAENAPRYFKLMHYVRRHANGHLTMFDNGADKKDKERTYSRVVEYDLDEVNKTATMVWEYTNDPNILALTGGSADRLSNGNTLINWGGAAKAGDAPAMTECNPAQELVYEIWPAQADVTGGFKRIIWPLDDQAINVTHYEIAAGNTYPESPPDETGVSFEVNSFVGDSYNEVYVKREPFAPLYPLFNSKAPRVLPVRITITDSFLDSMNADLALDAISFGFADSSGQFGYVNPDDLTIYYRSTVGSGLFVPLSTAYNSVKQELQATVTGFGEFIIGFPDLEEVPNPPLLIEPAGQGSVNQELPVSFSWTPRGFAPWNFLQVATDENFTTPVVNETWMSESRYTWSSALPNTTYYYRVQIYNEGGYSAWSTGSFQTVAPMIEATVPNGGENWNRGLDSFILWKDNIDEDVVLELYKDGSLTQEIATTSSIGAYEWEVGLALAPGCDYSIKIKSSVDEALFDVSNSFRIDMPDGDFNCNGCVKFDDFIELANQWLDTNNLTADIDNSGKVDFKDFTIFAGNWDLCPMAAKGDFNIDGCVDLNDLAEMSGQWLNIGDLITDIDN
ncbi:MAG: aryl-sulfate sulfotransferase, partial [Planctomycetota bacterium]